MIKTLIDIHFASHYGLDRVVTIDEVHTTISHFDLSENGGASVVEDTGMHGVLDDVVEYDAGIYQCSRRDRDCIRAVCRHRVAAGCGRCPDGVPPVPLLAIGDKRKGTVSWESPCYR